MYYLYHIPGKKIGVTRNLNKRVTLIQGYKEGEYKKERALEGHAQEAQIHLLKLILENEPKFTMDKEIETLIYNK